MSYNSDLCQLCGEIRSYLNHLIIYVSYKNEYRFVRSKMLFDCCDDCYDNHDKYEWDDIKDENEQIEQYINKIKEDFKFIKDETIEEIKKDCKNKNHVCVVPRLTYYKISEHDIF